MGSMSEKVKSTPIDSSTPAESLEVPQEKGAESTANAATLGSDASIYQVHVVPAEEIQPLTPGESTLGTPTKRRRTHKIDERIAEAKDVALHALLEITDEASIGLVHHLRGEEERLTTHLFECMLPGYRGWFWFATLARTPRSQHCTVCEIGLLPGDDSLLAPQWIPWSERDQEAELEHESDEEFTETVLASDDEDELDNDSSDNPAEEREPENAQKAETKQDSKQGAPTSRRRRRRGGKR